MIVASPFGATSLYLSQWDTHSLVAGWSFRFGRGQRNTCRFDNTAFVLPTIF